jgi:hypothetical protein
MDAPLLTASRARFDATTLQVAIPLSLVLFLVLLAILAAVGAPVWLYALALPAGVVATLAALFTMPRRSLVLEVYPDRIADLRGRTPTVIPFSRIESWRFQLLTDFGSFMQDRQLRIESDGANITIGRGIQDFRSVQDRIADLLPPEKLDGVRPPQAS